MRIFCTQCGEANEVEAGQFAVCAGCGSTLQQPGAASSQAPTPPASPPKSPFVGAPPAVTSAPPAESYRPLTSEPPQQQLNRGIPVTTFGSSGSPGPMVTSGMQETNKLAIASLVLGIVCCIPFSGVAALGLGATALKQIQERNEKGREMAIAGMVLGGLSMGMALISILISALGR